MRRFLVFIIGIVLSAEVFSLEIDYRLTGRGGAIMPDGKVDKIAGKPGEWLGGSVGGELAVTFHPEWPSMRQWNNAGLGVALSYWYHMQDELLGQSIAPYVFLDIPLVKVPHFVLGLRPGLGCSFQTKTFANTIDKPVYEVQSLAGSGGNYSIGSVFNFYFPEALYLEFPIKNGWSVIAEGGWYHISNGSIKQPNSGYNIFSGGIGARYVPTQDSWTEQSKLYQAPDEREKKWEIELALSAGGREVYYRDNAHFLTGSIQCAAYWRAHNIFRLGGGIDVFYDGAYVPRDTHFNKTNLQAADANGKDCWRLGISLQPEFVIGQFTAGIHAGVYLLDQIKNLEPSKEAKQSPTGKLDKGIFYSYDILNAGSAGYPDGWLYTEIVLRYHLPWHLFIQGEMKAHLTKVEYVGAGIGVWY